MTFLMDTRLVEHEVRVNALSVPGGAGPSLLLRVLFRVDSEVVGLGGGEPVSPEERQTTR